MYASTFKEIWSYAQATGQALEIFLVNGETEIIEPKTKFKFTDNFMSNDVFVGNNICIDLDYIVLIKTIPKESERISNNAIYKGE